MSEVELVDLARSAELLGPADSLVAACTMGLTGPMTGLLLLVFEDRSGFALVDLLLHQAMGTTTSWGELEESAAKETTNIVGCAYVNALATDLLGILTHEPNAMESIDTEDTLVPTPPLFVQEFAGSLLEFALMEQAIERDQVLLLHTRFGAGKERFRLDWTLLFIPSSATLHGLATALTKLDPDESDKNKMRS